MKYFLFFILLTVTTLGYAQANNEGDTLNSEEILRRAIMEGCMESKLDKSLNINQLEYCKCTYEGFLKLLLETGSDLNDVNAIAAIAKGAEYEKLVFDCIELGMKNAQREDAIFKEQCYKNLKRKVSKNKNTINNICDCSLAKYKDIGLSSDEFDLLPKDLQEKFIAKILMDCIVYEKEKSTK
ncbi:MAG: hypothetical protein LC105_02145 [Chitinophagales bacterium]|nr:hypothetical protein [Chitinophagales bacterium]